MEIPPCNYRESPSFENSKSSTALINDVHQNLCTIYSIINDALNIKGSSADKLAYLSQHGGSQLSACLKNIDADITTLGHDKHFRTFISDLQNRLGELNNMINTLTTDMTAGNASDGVAQMKGLFFLIGDPKDPSLNGLAEAFIIDPKKPPYFPVG
jgi:hypothetical protein